RGAGHGGAELHREAEAAALERADGDLALHAHAADGDLLLAGDELAGAAEAGRIAGGEEVLRRGGALATGAAHGLGDGELDVDDAARVVGRSVAASDGLGGGGVEALL